MCDGDRSAQIVRFGIFEADLQTGELRKSGIKVRLQGQPFQVCAILLEHSGNLVTREELRQKVWPEDTFVDFDHALNTAITKIRIALGDDADNPRFVETLPRRGYRFIGPVDKPSSQAPSPSLPKGRFERLTAKWSWVGAGAAALVLLSTIAIWRLSRKPAESSLPSVEVVPLVAVQGKQVTPAFSPDGNQVAFAGSQGPNTGGIYTTLVGGEKSLRLTSDPGDCCPTWSPDGRQIAFTRYSGSELTIYIIPALGGTEHKLYTGPASHWQYGLDWSPDGNVLAFLESNADRVHSRIALLSLTDLTHTPAHITARSGERRSTRFFPRRFDSGFPARGRREWRGRLVCAAGQRRRAQTTYFRQLHRIRVSCLDSGRSRYRVGFPAWRAF